MKRLLLGGLAVAVAGGLALPLAHAESKPTCEIKLVQADWIKKHDAIKQLRDALATANKDVPKYPLKDFGYDDESQKAGQKAAIGLVNDTDAAFKSLIGLIASRRTRVCAVCGLKEDYLVAKQGGILDVTEPELLASELRLVFVDLASFAEQIDARKKRLASETDIFKKRELERDIEAIEGRSKQTKQKLDDYRTAHPGQLPIGDELAKYECK
jgi:hypothetical protein